jgi:hypothetical protein
MLARLSFAMNLEVLLLLRSQTRPYSLRNRWNHRAPHSGINLFMAEMYRGIVVGKIGEIECEARGGKHPHQCGKNGSPRQPAPFRLLPIRPETINGRNGSSNNDRNQRPPRQACRAKLLSIRSLKSLPMKTAFAHKRGPDHFAAIHRCANDRGRRIEARSNGPRCGRRLGLRGGCGEPDR